MFCGLCVKLLKLKINVRLSAEICMPQMLSVRNEHALHLVDEISCVTPRFMGVI